MKKIFTIVVILFSLFSESNTKPINESTAGLVARYFVQSKISSTCFQTFKPNNINQNNPIKLDIAFKALIADNDIINTGNSNAYYYIFNISNAGYIIVSGDDNVTPILAYSDAGSITPDNIPTNVQKWLDGYKHQIKYAIENHTSATEQIKMQWSDCISGRSQKLNLDDNSVMPLIETQWNQAPFYNELCPGGSVTGCVATAMAQVLKYWNYPERGVFSHSYDHSVYGNLTANFGKTLY